MGALLSPLQAGPISGSGGCRGGEVLAIGGDVGITRRTRKLLNNVAAHHDVDAFVVGGDIAYADVVAWQRAEESE